MSYILHPPMLDELGLVPALREYVQGSSERTGLRIELTIQDEFPRVEDEIAITIFRIVQECLMNVHGHSGSSEAKIALTYDEKEIRLRVADTGRGINQGTGDSQEKDRSDRKAGVGLASMKERVTYLGGTLEVLSDGREKGFIIRF